MNEDYVNDYEEIEDSNFDTDFENDIDSDTEEVDHDDGHDLYYEEPKPINAHALAFARLRKGAYIERGYDVADAELKAKKEYEELLEKDTEQNQRLMKRYEPELKRLAKQYDITDFETELVAIMTAEQCSGPEAVKILQKEIESAPPAPKGIKKLSAEDRKTFLDMKAIHPDYTVERFMKTKKFLER